MLPQMNRSGRFGAKGDTVNTTHKIKAATATLTVGFLLTIAFAATAQAANGTSQRITSQERQAVRARADATNRHYQLGVFGPEQLRAEAINRFYHLEITNGVPAQQAEKLRSEALNRVYHLGVYTTTGAAVQQAEKLRGEAMNRAYRLGVYSSTGTAAQRARAQAMNRFYRLGNSAVVGTSSTFDWSNMGIGAGGFLGLIVVAGGMTVLVRRRTTERPSSPSTT